MQFFINPENSGVYAFEDSVPRVQIPPSYTQITAEAVSAHLDSIALPTTQSATDTPSGKISAP